MNTSTDRIEYFAEKYPEVYGFHHAAVNLRARFLLKRSRYTYTGAIYASSSSLNFNGTKSMFNFQIYYNKSRRIHLRIIKSESALIRF